MFRQLSLEAFKQVSYQQKRAIVYQEFPCDDLTPIQAFLALDAYHEGAFLFESAGSDQRKFAYLALNPFAEFRAKGFHSTLMTGERIVEQTSDPFEHLRHTLFNLGVSLDGENLPFLGGPVGFMAYDAIRLLEQIPDEHPDRAQLPDLFFLFHEMSLIFDQMKGSVLIAINRELSADRDADYAEALKQIHTMRLALQNSPKNKEKTACPVSFEEELNDAQFCEKVRQAQEFIRKGDAFQIVLSRSFRSDFRGCPFDVYRALRRTNPSPFMFYLQTKDFVIVGSSPERLVRMEKNQLQMTPIAGTRPRIKGEEERLKLELLHDSKEEAEHMMLVDLGRNDLGVVAKVGSVRVKELKTVREFPHVMHLVSQIEAELAEGRDALDVLKAVFPAGTLTGAPKIRAMELIDELEVSRRGLYGGAICMLDVQGNLESWIAIRTAVFQNGGVTVRAGGGIVLDSDPQKEAEETRMKAKGVMEAIKLAGEGIL
jgi:anthranilate synthase component 1